MSFPTAYKPSGATVSIANGATTATFTGTLLTTGCLDGDQLFVIDGGAVKGPFEIQVSSDTTTTLGRAYDGTGGSGMSFWINRTSILRTGVAVSIQVSNLLDKYSGLINVAGADRVFTLDKAASGDSAGIEYRQGGDAKIRTGLLSDNNYHIQFLDGATWTDALLVNSATGAVILPGSSTGDVTGAASSTDSNFALFSGSSGKTLKDGGISLDADTALSANSDTRVASQKAVKAYVNALLAAQDAMIFKGVINCSANPNYPAADAGHVYKVSVAGKIGGASGANVEAGDTLYCITDSTASGNQATVGSAWNIVQVNIDGAVIGPASATGDNLVTFNGTSGKTVKDSGKAAPTGTIVGTSDTQSLSNKRLQPRVSSAASGDISPDISAADVYVRTALAAGAAVNAPSGTPVVAEKLIFRLKDNGTSRALTWNAIFRAVGVTIPSATTVGKTTYVGAIYNATDTKWDVIAAGTEA